MQPSNRLSFLSSVDDTTKITLGVGILVFDQGRVLLEKREDCGLWCCPGGRMSPGENVKETALRELKEETNIDAKIEGLLGVYSDPKYGSVRKYNDDDFSQQIIDIMFHASPLSFDIKKSDESLDVKFLDLDNLPENITPTIKNVLQDYKDKQDDSPIVK